MNRYFRQLGFLLIAFSISSFSYSQDDSLDISEFNHVIKDFVKERKMHCVYRVDEIDNETKEIRNVLKGAHGMYNSFMDIEEDNVFPIMSGTKLMTSSLLFKLIEKGLIKLDDSIFEALGKDHYIWKNFSPPEWVHQINISGLLSNSTGIRDYIYDYIYSLDISKVKDIKSAKIQVAKKIFQSDLSFEPKTEYEYSNSNFFILGLVLERFFEKDIDKIFQEEIFNPLDMKESRIPSFDEKDILFNDGVETKLVRYFLLDKNLTDYGLIRYFISGFIEDRIDSYKGFTRVMAPNVRAIPFSDGGVLSTTKDANKWLFAVHNKDFLSKSSYLNIFRPYKKSEYKDIPNDNDRFYGYGTFIIPVDENYTLMGHMGEALGVRSEIMYLKSKKSKSYAISIFSNQLVFPYLQYRKDNIDFSRLENQFDIIFLRNFIVDYIRK